MPSSEVTLFTAAEIMTTEVVAVGPEMPIEEAVELFEVHKLSGFPVVDDQLNLLGIITEYDLLQRLGTLEMQGKVADFMTTDVTTTGTGTTLVELIDTLVSTRFRRVPVTTDGKLVGIISRRDVLFAGNVRQQTLAGLPTYSAPAKV